MRRLLGLSILPLALAATSVWCLVQAMEADRDTASSPAGFGGAGLGILAEPAAAAQGQPPPSTEARPATTPLLSARRIPTLLVQPVAKRNLAARLDSFVEGNPAGTCIAVTDAGVDLYGSRENDPMIPASTEKLLTAHGVLSTLGPDATLETTLISRSAPTSGTVAGDVWLVGGGDPLLNTELYRARGRGADQVHTDLNVLADEVVAAGIRRIDGGVIGDETRYDDQRAVPSWPDRFVSRNLAGPLSALVVNDGVFNDDGILRRSSEPALSAVESFVDLLAERGVTVEGTEELGPAPDDAAVVLASAGSLPASDIVAQMLTYSDNTTAELQLKELGFRASGLGSTVSGSEAVAAALDEAGLDRAERVTIDGSGLDAGNRVTCDLLVDVLDDHGPSGPMADGLAVAGQSGTLAERFIGSPAEGLVRAKTGSLRDVTALAGFVEVPETDMLTFAVVVNTTDGELVDDALKLRQNEVAEILLTWPEGPDPTLLTPR
jgi:D-alanyl-D-alanine carboxypeptidase/D-alanyl-D-alanine-endopeptidase (penicillin-binding protein 4)